MSIIEGLEIDLDEALAVAIEAACIAGKIIWSAVQERRTAVAASHAPSVLPSRSQQLTSEQKESEASAEANFNSATAVGGSKADVTLPPLDSPHSRRANSATPSMLSTPTSGGLHIECKDSSTDLVTQYDRRCDAAIIETLQQYCDRVEREKPSVKFTFITEELNPSVTLGDGLTWIVDPIDGTMSFVHGLPDCCVSIGLSWKGEPILAVVFCPFLVSGGVTITQTSQARHSIISLMGGGGGGGGQQQQQYASPTLSAASGTTSFLALPVSATSANNGVTQRPLSPQRMIPQPPAASGTPGGRRANSTTRPMHSSGSSHGLVECSGELFTAIKGRGCYINGVRLNVNVEAAVKTAMVVFNYPFNVRLTPQEEKAAGITSSADPLSSDEKGGSSGSDSLRRESIRKAKYDLAVDAAAKLRAKMALDMVPGMRAYGSAVVALSQLAAGRIDLYLEPSGKAWDVCAGSLLVTEAGGCVCNLHGKPFDMKRDTTIIAAANETLSAYAATMCREAQYGQYWLLD